MTWYERREMLLYIALTHPGYDRPRLHGDRWKGRLLVKPMELRSRIGTITIPEGTIVNMPDIEAMFAAKQKAQTMRLPK